MVSRRKRMPPIDSDGVSRALEGDAEAARRLVMAISPLLYRTCRCHGFNQQEAEDLTQECLLKMWRALERFDSAKANVEAWALGILHNLIIDEFRRRGRSVNGVPLTGEETVSDAHQTSFDDVIVGRLHVEVALLKLTFTQRALVWLVDGLGLSVAEAAQVIRATTQKPLTDSNAYYHLGQSRGALREALRRPSSDHKERT
jgi:RNA polymerase sigma-70 factor (ECF subfamily)